MILAVLGAAILLAGCGDPEPKLTDGQSIQNPLGNRAASSGNPASDPAARARAQVEKARQLSERTKP